MNSAKLNLLKKTFEASFDIDVFRKFTKEFFDEPEMFPFKRKTGIWREYNDHVSSYSEIAKYTDANDQNLIVLAVEITKDKSVERARSMQRNFVSKILDINNYEAAIVAFYSPIEQNWRLSFVRLDYTLSEKGLSLDLTPARRYSYLVGKNEPIHTAQQQLLPIFENDKHNPSLDEIEEAFSVEKVTKDFYKQYLQKYIELKEYLEKNKAFITETKKLGLTVEKFSEQFAKKLMGQLAFLYFLQKKGWLGVRMLPEDRSLTEDEYQMVYIKKDEIHREVLGKVFSETKNGKRALSSIKLLSLSEREAELLSECFAGTESEQPWGQGNKQFIRQIFNYCIKNTNNNFFEEFLEPLFYDALNKNRKNQYFKKFNCKIPFLNGGLFEPLEGYNWQDVDFNIPNKLFSNEKENGKDADGILDIFDRFNFTINESEPLEKEVAVDPEMLGKIFENLLDVTDRKSKGAFYTPREIVHYMCQESLTNYLVNEVNVPYEDIKQFIQYGELIRDADKRRNVGYGKEFTIKESIFNNIVAIDQALKSIKVADPAVGSGAFPLGMLSEIVRLRNNITEYIIRKDKEGALGRKFGEEIIRKNRSPYKLKWETIKNSIFAVDIEPSAVDIAKLRLWLSVVVDQEINNETPEPHPLPNLDCNIMVGNALVDEYEGIKLFDENALTKKKNSIKGTSETYNLGFQLSLLIDNTDEMLNEMFQLQDRYFDEEHEQRKKDLKQRIDSIRDDLIEYKLQLDGNENSLDKYRKLKKNKQRPYFLWGLEFAKVYKEKGGFDVVIGNPPYGAKIDVNLRTHLTPKFPNVPDFEIYYYFISLGNNICKEKGILSFIIPNTFLMNVYAKKYREMTLENWEVKGIDNLTDFDVFESASVRNCILLLQKGTLNENWSAKFTTLSANGKGIEVINTKTPYKEKLMNHSNNWHSIFLSNDIIDTLLEKIEQHSDALNDFLDAKQGYIPYRKTTLIKKFGEDEGINILKGRLWHSTEKIDHNYKKELQGKDVEKFSVMWSGKYVKYGDWVSTYVDLKYFSGPRLLFREITRGLPYSLIVGYSEEESVNNPSVITAIPRSNNTLPLYYLLGLCNSKLISFYFINKAPKARKGLFPKVIVNDVRNLPIKIGTKKQLSLVCEIVEKILKITNDLDYLKNNEKKKRVNELGLQIDYLVYEIYGLTDLEISLIENFEV